MVEQQLRTFLLTTSGLIFALTPIELLVTEHYQDVVQWSPFVFCGLGLMVVIPAILRPTRPVILAVRVVVLILVLGSLFGLYEHIEHNIAFEREIRPAAGTPEIVWEALFGASPLLAPAILGLGAALALAATYRHPALSRPQGRLG